MLKLKDYSIAYFDCITTFEALYSKHCIAELNLKAGLVRLHYASDSPASHLNLNEVQQYGASSMAKVHDNNVQFLHGTVILYMTSHWSPLDSDLWSR